MYERMERRIVANFKTRPSGPKREGDSRLRSVAKRLRDVIADTQRSFGRRDLRLVSQGVHALAEILTEFAEDLHNDIGMWSAYESHNMRCFGTPLPITFKCDQTEVLAAGIDVNRVHHFLWCLYPQMLPGAIIAPRNPDLVRLACAVTDSLIRSFQKVPASSGVKAFVSQPNDFGWDVKRKLVWLGSRSYLFRTAFQNYITGKDAAEARGSVDVTDDFICQECTPWSGLGAIDILATVLEISESERDDLLSWNERHVAPYMILTADTGIMRVLNVVSRKEYPVRMNVERNLFKVGSMVVGGLVPWRGEWYWSGQQRQYTDPSDESIEHMKGEFLRQCPRLVSRYCEDYARQAAIQCREHYERHVARHGKKLVVFQDGLSLAAAIEEWARRPFRDLSEEEQETMRGRHSLPKSGPPVNIPESLLRSEHEIGVFFSPEEHMEIMDHFDTLVRGLESPVQPLPEDEAAAIHGFVQSPQISPAFVRHVAELYGVDSIKSAFLLDTCDDECWLDYLLRGHKGEYFKKRYPPVAVI